MFSVPVRIAQDQRQRPQEEREPQGIKVPGACPVYLWDQPQPPQPAITRHAEAGPASEEGQEAPPHGLLPLLKHCD